MEYSRQREKKHPSNERITMVIFSVDVGGTKTHAALYQGEKSPTLVKERVYLNRHYDGIEAILQEFLDEGPQKRELVSALVIGVAGDVREGSCKVTNLPWTIEAEKIAKKTGIASVSLLNDLEAQACGWAYSPVCTTRVLQVGGGDAGSRVLLSAGTGLGEALLCWDGEKYLPMPTEGGHTDFAPRNSEEEAFWEFLHKRYEHVSYERVVSGMGIANLYAFLLETGRKKGERAYLEAEEPARRIIEAAVQKKEPAALFAIEWFLSLYGAEAGNLALKAGARGGVGLSGNLSRYLFSHFSAQSFLESFCAKGRKRDLLSSFSVELILEERLALEGACYFALQSRKPASGDKGRA